MHAEIYQLHPKRHVLPHNEYALEVSIFLTKQVYYTKRLKLMAKMAPNLSQGVFYLATTPKVDSSNLAWDRPAHQHVHIQEEQKVILPSITAKMLCQQTLEQCLPLPRGLGLAPPQGLDPPHDPREAFLLRLWRIEYF